ncbi:LPXTG cell wall anchor domain-containing protein [Antiquaquibacter soli]|uniref:LPXTG cell wall anchor domain-containing protein n=1 Tax=Antiquaquibacter soli TaxID=3064523 RepID=A0ABT9BL00_9MICO|nr:LPXTG cell wall anchor domain-containing protein [Protaetiibacter sp. WY-16]MDO7881244.1 LPXTG cell wall anchor domain-containing protein [Protaetiibacter sp. WY-16]
MRPNLLRRAAATTAVAVVLVSVTAMPASADPWDGNAIDFGLGKWYPTVNPFALEDVDLRYPNSSLEVTDLWDGMGSQRITATASNIDDVPLDCGSAADMDVSVDSETGDLVLQCSVYPLAFAEAHLFVTAQIRIYAASDLIRVSSILSNIGESAVTVDAVTFDTNFGSDGELWGYQGQSDSVLPVPAAEDEASRAALVGAGAQWAVHYQEYDAPGGIAWGAAGASTPSGLSDLDGDDYEVTVAPFSIPRGESRAVAYFALWNPQTLIDLDYTQNDNLSQVAAADALVTAMSEFDSFDGRLTDGLEGLDVVNWGSIPGDAEEPPAAPQLAATGADSATGALAALVLAVLGAGALIAARRRATSR